MTRKAITVTVLISILLAGPLTASAAPPARPLAPTAEQFEALRQLEIQPQHAAVLDVHATYKSEREQSLEATRLSDDIWTVAYTGGFPAILLMVLICAAPL